MFFIFNCLKATDGNSTEDSKAATKRSESESSGENEVPNKKPKLAENATAETTNASTASEADAASTTTSTLTTTTSTTTTTTTAATTVTPAATSLIKPIGDKKNDIGKEAAIEAEVRAARERALVPLDLRVKQFKEMLKEKDVNQYTHHFLHIRFH